MISKISALMLFTVLLFSQCKKEEITSDVRFVESTYFGDCFMMLGNTDTEKIVIRSQEEYEAYFEKIAGGSECPTTKPTAIDFDKYTLLGTQTSGGGCEVTYDRQVEQKGNKEVTYTIKVKYVGFCKMMIQNMNWAIIPKIKKRTDVIFEIEEIGSQ